MSMCAALRAALAEVEITPADAAAVALAEQYAEAIDHGYAEDPLATYGPKLLACLDALRLTPKARTVAMKGGKADAPEQRNPADELRARRTARLAGTEAVDTATP